MSENVMGAPPVKGAVKTSKEVGKTTHTASEYKDLIDAYKKVNPVKYAIKKDALEAKLKALGGEKKEDKKEESKKVKK